MAFKVILIKFSLEELIKSSIRPFKSFKYLLELPLYNYRSTKGILA